MARAERALRREAPAPEPGQAEDRRAEPSRTESVRVAPEALRREAPEQRPAEPVRVAAPKTERRPRRRWLRRILLLLGPLLFVAGGLALYLSGGRYVSTDNAYMQAAKETISTDVSGIVAAVEVRDNEPVKAGQVLFRLDDEPYRIALASAQAQLGIVRNQIANLKATYAYNLAQVQQAQTDIAFYQRQYQRQAELASRAVATQVSLEQARHDLESARDRLAMYQYQAQATLAQLGGDANEPVERNPSYRQAQAQVDKAERDLRHTVVTAPLAGIVTNVNALQVGQYLPAAQGAFSLVATDHVWVEANPKETDLTYVKPGDSATVTVDTYPDREWRATVSSISPATGAEFSVLPAQNASGNWVKVVQRVPVRLRVDIPEGAPPLRSGMSVVVDIDTGHERTLADLWESVRRWFGGWL